MASAPSAAPPNAPARAPRADMTRIPSHWRMLGIMRASVPADHPTIPMWNSYTYLHTFCIVVGVRSAVPGAVVEREATSFRRDSLMPRSLCLLLLIVGACVRSSLPITATQLAQSRDRSALVAYLGQRDASPTVCDLASDGPHVQALDANVRDELMAALRDSRLAPSLWSNCVGRLIRSADLESARSIYDAVARDYVEMLVGGSVDRDTLAAERLSVMHLLLLSRRGDVAPHTETMGNRLDVLRDRVVRGRLGPVATRYAKEMIADVEIERGTREGRPVDEAVLDELLRARDESTLWQYERRLPDARLRQQAKRRIIRLHIQASRFAEVRQNAVAIEETMMLSGLNAADLREHRPVRGWIDSSTLAMRGVLVRQDLLHRTSALLGYADGVGEKGSISVFPQLQLRTMLRVLLD